MLHKRNLRNITIIFLKKQKSDTIMDKMVSAKILNMILQQRYLAPSHTI